MKQLRNGNNGQYSQLHNTLHPSHNTNFQYVNFKNLYTKIFDLPDNFMIFVIMCRWVSRSAFAQLGSL